MPAERQSSSMAAGWRRWKIASPPHHPNQPASASLATGCVNAGTFLAQAKKPFVDVAARTRDADPAWSYRGADMANGRRFRCKLPVA